MSAPVGSSVSPVAWRSARTMPKRPHPHVMEDWNPGREVEVTELVRRIFEEGRDEVWGERERCRPRVARCDESCDGPERATDATIDDADWAHPAREDGREPADGFPRPPAARACP